YGSFTQRGSVWSKSLLQFVTGGRSPMAFSSELGIRRDDRHRVLGTVGHRQARLLLEFPRNQSVSDLPGAPVVVDLEQLRCQGKTTVVALAPVPIDVNFERKAHRFQHPAATTSPST